MQCLMSHKRVWRMVLLGLVFVALLGPWAFDKINVPAEYPCSAPFIRLEGDFCGYPLSGFWILSALSSEFINNVREISAGTMLPSNLPSGLFFGALLFLLPSISMLLLILTGERSLLQIFNAVVWGLAAGITLLLWFAPYSNIYWALWGVWLFTGVAVFVMLQELLMLRAGKRLNTG